MLSKRLIPRDPDARPTIFDVALTNAWIYLEMVHADPSNMIPAEHIFQPEGTSVTVHFVDDFMSEMQYVIIKGERPAEIEVVAEDICNTIPIYTAEEIVALYSAATTREAQIKAVSMAGVAAPGKCNNQFLGVFRDAMEAADADLRIAAIQATAYAGWPELEPLLAERVSRDPDENIRNDAAIMQQAMMGAR